MGCSSQWLGTFGEANALWESKRKSNATALGAAARRGARASPRRAPAGSPGSSCSPSSGGRPPWVSGLAQGTASQALARAASKLGAARLFAAAPRRSASSRPPPPEGVALTTDGGAHYLIYSFALEAAHPQRLHAGAQRPLRLRALTGSAEGRALFEAGDRAAQAELADYDTGAWSLYSGRVNGVRPRLPQLAARLPRRASASARATAVYCDTAAAPSPRYWPRRPRCASSRSRRLRRQEAACAIRFTLSKVSTVTLYVDGERVTSARRLGHGTQTLTWAGAAQAGRLDGAHRRARDLAGNAARPRASCTLSAARKARRRSRLGPRMAPRTILYTGKGGVGKTSVAAATARRCAAAGLRTIVLSTDPAHSLADALDRELGGRADAARRRPVGPAGLGAGRDGAPLDRVQAWLGELLLERGVDRISAEELTVPPGMDELFSLLQLKRHHESGEYDVVVVDCAPTGETLRLLSFPDVARWWLEQGLPAAEPHPRRRAAVRPRGAGPARCRATTCSTRSTRLVAQPHRDERDPPRPRARLAAAGDDPGPDGHRRGPPHVHLPQPLRVPDRRRRGQPAVPARRSAPTSAPGASASSSDARRGARRVRPRARPARAVLRRGGRRRRTLDELGAALFAGRDAAARAARPGSRRSCAPDDGAACCGSTCRSRPGATSALRKIGAELVVRVDGHKRTLVLPPALAGIVPTAPPSPTARSSCGSTDPDADARP